MFRRSTRLARLLLLSVVVGFSLSAVAAEVPSVLQPTDPSFSADERAALAAALGEIEKTLLQAYPVPTYRLVSHGWVDRDFVLFAAGRLEAEGYPVLVVEGVMSNGSSHLWLLVGVDLGERTVWIPVEATPTSGGALGTIPWAGAPGVAFASEYMTPGRIVEIAPNRAPTASFMVVGAAVIEEDTGLHANAQDPDGTIIAYVWSVDGEFASAETSPIYRHTFPAVREYQVTLTVFDNRGATASVSKRVDVEAEAGCGCH